MIQETVNKTKIWMLITSFILTSVSVLIYLGFNLTIPSFAEIFKGFGKELPTLTIYVCGYYHMFIWFSLIGIIPTVVLIINRDIEPSLRKQLFSLVIFSACLAFVMQILVIYSMYLPIMTMGETV